MKKDVKSPRKKKVDRERSEKHRGGEERRREEER